MLLNDPDDPDLGQSIVIWLTLVVIFFALGVGQSINQEIQFIDMYALVCLSGSVAYTEKGAANLEVHIVDLLY